MCSLDDSSHFPTLAKELQIVSLRDFLFQRLMLVFSRCRFLSSPDKQTIATLFLGNPFYSRLNFRSPWTFCDEPLPFPAFDVTEVGWLYRHMQRSGHSPISKYSIPLFSAISSDLSFLLAPRAPEALF